jgi:hypothetical protein
VDSALEIAGVGGKGTGRWRLTAQSDEGGGGPHGDTSHDHDSAEEAETCALCDEYCSRWAGFPSRKRQAEMEEERDLKEYERLKGKFEQSETNEK